MRPAYITGSPVQAQYAWNRQPYFYSMEDLMRYNTQSGIPASPWGLRQGFFEPGTVAAPTRAPAMTQAQFNAMNLPRVPTWTTNTVAPVAPTPLSTTVPGLENLPAYDPYPTPLVNISVPPTQTTTTTKVP